MYSAAARKDTSLRISCNIDHQKRENLSAMWCYRESAAAVSPRKSSLLFHNQTANITAVLKDVAHDQKWNVVHLICTCQMLLHPSATQWWNCSLQGINSALYLWMRYWSHANTYLIISCVCVCVIASKNPEVLATAGFIPFSIKQTFFYSAVLTGKYYTDFLFSQIQEDVCW